MSEEEKTAGEINNIKIEGDSYLVEKGNDWWN